MKGGRRNIYLSVCHSVIHSVILSVTPVLTIKYTSYLCPSTLQGVDTYTYLQYNMQQKNLDRWVSRILYCDFISVLYGDSVCDSKLDRSGSKLDPSRFRIDRSGSKLDPSGFRIG